MVCRTFLLRQVFSRAAALQEVFQSSLLHNWPSLGALYLHLKFVVFNGAGPDSECDIIRTTFSRDHCSVLRGIQR